MRPVLLKGHERPLTYVKYTHEGDLFFTCAKDHHPTVWFGDTGERLGTYIGHNGAVMSCDVTRDSARLVTASMDQTMMIWDTQTGTRLFERKFEGPARHVKLSLGERELLITVDAFMGADPCIQVFGVNEERDALSEPKLKLYGPQGRITRAAWGPLNETIISTGEDGVLTKWDVPTGKMLDQVEAHGKMTQDLEMSADGSCFLTASLDKTAKLWDSRTLQCVKTYTTERPLNACAMSNLMEHVVLGGGQDASQVTTTAGAAGKFEAMFYHKVYENLLGNVKGHFGPINALTFSPDGRSFVSGGEDGYVRLHHFDADYYHMK
mmetsp:Transcript_1151/g.1614  ORF Transcript_1151/g.1614 Transcript_1151/m.1614 type:complete len:322 (-) Transcript_1151:306-1271(-)|eukprot:CAMPEP_0196579592 /NCGR_PEP_ID=MMETSP1081-20130531/23205_1 /TAXON_ID=36882 /ORGANISM="Pyramimonas amylifera, Strain CCMP720" /LENGTH=321 /DNA_ID=CAMNT_0041899221 /DNA_START=81 /DNA_END=1046 /DNA_ORIENTATION=+